jgi:hypothetical protein
MRKSVGSIVLTVFFVSLYAPIAAALAMPAHACCFAHGEHHCASAASPSGEPAVSAPCPHHGGRAISSSVLAATPRPTQCSTTASDFVVISHDSPVPPISVAHADGRAPPSFLS